MKSSKDAKTKQYRSGFHGIPPNPFKRTVRSKYTPHTGAKERAKMARRSP